MIKIPKDSTTSTSSGQTNARWVLQVDRQIPRVNKLVLRVDRRMDIQVPRVDKRILQVDKRVLLVEKWLLREGKEYYE